MLQSTTTVEQGQVSFVISKSLLKQRHLADRNVVIQTAGVVQKYKDNSYNYGLHRPSCRRYS